MQTSLNVVGLEAGAKVEKIINVNVKVDRLGPDFIIRPGVAYDFFDGKVMATHAGLLGGRIMAANLDWLEDYASLRRFYVKRKKDTRFAIFPYHCSWMRGYDYSHIQWKKELMDDEVVVLLIKPKKNSLVRE